MQSAMLRSAWHGVARHPSHIIRTSSSRRQHTAAPAGTPAAASTEIASTSAPATSSWRPGCDIRMLYDGECSLCMKEVKFLQQRDASARRIDFIDIAAPNYSPADNAGITFQQAMERIHAVLPDGTIVRDVEVFRRLYEAVGLGWVYAATRYQPVLDAANALYGVWAQYRTQITGREALDVILARHQQQQQGGATGSLCRDANGNLTDAACELPQKQP